MASSSSPSPPFWITSDDKLRRAIKISQAQRNLLNQDNAWASKTPTGAPNIPAPILTSLRDLRSLKLKSKSNGGARRATSPDDAQQLPAYTQDRAQTSSHPAASSPGEPIATSWSTSPSTNLTPPNPLRNAPRDSSPAASTRQPLTTAQKSTASQQGSTLPVLEGIQEHSSAREGVESERHEDEEEDIQSQYNPQATISPTQPLSPPEPSRRRRKPQFPAIALFPPSEANFDHPIQSPRTLAALHNATLKDVSQHTALTPPSAQVIPCTKPSLKRKKVKKLDWDKQLEGLSDEAGNSRCRPVSRRQQMELVSGVEDSESSSQSMIPATDHSDKFGGVASGRCGNEKLALERPNRSILGKSPSIHESSIYPWRHSPQSTVPVPTPTASPQLQGSLEWNSSCPNQPFPTFCSLYPDHKGSLLDFVRACANLDELRTGRKLPSFLYDDFIRVFSTAYIDYVFGYPESSQDVLTAIEYYNDNCERPVFQKGVISKRNLRRVLGEYPDEIAKIRALLQGSTSSTTRPSTLEPGAVEDIPEVFMTQEPGLPPSQPAPPIFTQPSAPTADETIIPETTFPKSRVFQQARTFDGKEACGAPTSIETGPELRQSSLTSIHQKKIASIVGNNKSPSTNRRASVLSAMSIPSSSRRSTSSGRVTRRMTDTKSKKTERARQWILKYSKPESIAPDSSTGEG